MSNIKLKLLSNRKFTITNIDENYLLEDENNATSIEIEFPKEYENYSKRIDFMNCKKEKWTTSLYEPENEENIYGEGFDKLNFTFTIPDAMAKRGELKIQPIAYLADGTDTIVPFKILIVTINDSILYAKTQGKNNPDLVIKAYEYSNKALELSREAFQKTEEAKEAAVSAKNSATSSANSATIANARANAAKTSAEEAQKSALDAKISANTAQTSAKEAQASADNADKRATSAETVSKDANTKSTNAVNTANSANTKSTQALDIVENLTVTSEELPCTEKVKVEIETNSSTKRKNIKFSVPAPKQGKSYRAKGPWENDIEYSNNEYYIDTVSRHGCTYWCKQTNKAHEPIVNTEDEYWGLLAQKGSDAGVTIVDNLESEHADYVLSAKQGKVLKELIASSIEKAISDLVNNAPENLNTLKEIADAIDNDPKFGTTVKNLIKTNSDNITKIVNGTTKVKKSENTEYLVSQDTREANTTPLDYMSNSSRQMRVEFKKLSTIGANSVLTGEYCQILTLIPWSDKSGGYPTQIAINTSGIAYRTGTGDSTWNDWKIVVTSASRSTLGDITVSSINIVT